MDSALVNGPTYEVVVHEEEGWVELAEQDPIAQLMLTIIPERELQGMEEDADQYLRPVLEFLQDCHIRMGNERVPPMRVCRPIRNVLVKLQIGCQYRCAIGSAVDHFEQAGKNIRQLRDGPLADHPEAMERLDAVEDVIGAYREMQVDGLRFRPEGVDRSEKIEALDDEMVRSLSTRKLDLNRIQTPLDTRVNRCARGVEEILDGPLSSILRAGIDAYALFDPSGLTVAGGAALGSLNQILGRAELETFVPSRFNDMGLGFFENVGVAVTHRYGSQVDFYVES